MKSLKNVSNQGESKVLTYFYIIILLTSISIYTYIFSSHLTSKHHGFATFAWDLGIFDQSFYTTAFESKVFFSTAELYLNPTGSYFGSKFSPILYLLVPFYALAPKASTLLILKTTLLALAAIPLYLICNQITQNEKSSLLIAWIYLLYPGLHGANNFDFQQQAFIPVMIFSLIHLYMKKQWKLYTVFLFLSVTITEHVSIILFLIISYLAYIDIKFNPEKIKGWFSTKRTILFSTQIFTILSYFISKHIRSLYPVNETFLDYYQAESTFSVLGFDRDITTLPLYLLNNIEKLVEAISHDYLFKLLYLIFLLAPLLFISLKSELIIAFIILITPFIISNYRPYYLLGSHYSLYLIPVIFLTMIEGLTNRKLGTNTNNYNQQEQNHMKIDIRTILIVTIILSTSLSPISPFVGTIQNYPIQWYSKTFENDAFVDTLHELIELAPKNASILVQNTIFPHVSNRLNAYVLPVINSPGAENYLKQYITDQVDSSEYILIDLETMDIWRSYLMQVLENRTDIEPYAFARSAILFKKDFKGDPRFIPNQDTQTFYASRDMHLYLGTPIKDTTAPSKSSVQTCIGEGSGAVIYGPYIALPVGEYTVNFTIRVTSYNSSEVATFDACDELGEYIMNSITLNTSNIELNKWTQVSLPIQVEKLRTKIEFRIFTSGTSDFYCEKLTVTRK